MSESGKLTVNNPNINSNINTETVPVVHSSSLQEVETETLPSSCNEDNGSTTTTTETDGIAFTGRSGNNVVENDAVVTRQMKEKRNSDQHKDEKQQNVQPTPSSSRSSNVVPLEIRSQIEEKKGQQQRQAYYSNNKRIESRRYESSPSFKERNKQIEMLLDRTETTNTAEEAAAAAATTTTARVSEEDDTPNAAYDHQPGAFRIPGLNAQQHGREDSNATITIGVDNDYDETVRSMGRESLKSLLFSARLVPDEVLDETELDRIRREASKDAERRILTSIVEAEEYKDPFCPRCTNKFKAIVLIGFVLIAIFIATAITGILRLRGELAEYQLDLENEVCERAIAMNLSSPTMGGNSTDDDDAALPTTVIRACLVDDDHEDRSNSSSNGVVVVGLWYTIVGTGYPIKASTCNDMTNVFGSQISVFQGNCSNLECLPTVNNHPCGLQSETSWPSVEDRVYSVLVHNGWTGTNDDDAISANNAAALFVLTIEETVENDFCETAIGPVNTDGESIAGTTASSSISELEYCDGSTYASPGVYYTVTGRGTSLVAFAASSSSHTHIDVFRGDDCQNLECVAASGDDPFSYGSSVNWMANDGETYYLLIHGENERDSADFTLTIKEAEINNMCRTAIGPLKTQNEGSVTHGSTEHSVAIDQPPFCGSSANTGPGVWYKVIGTGGAIMASTCSGITFFDASISVFRGLSSVLVEQNGNYDECAHLECIDGSNDACGDDNDFRGSIVQWSSMRGMFYYILVTGDMGQTGKFTLTVREFTPSEYDTCESAMNITLVVGDDDGSSLGDDSNNNNGSMGHRSFQTVGSNINATFDENRVVCKGGPYRTGSGTWYSVWGTGKELSASTCDGADFDTQITIFTVAGNTSDSISNETCTGLVCVDWDDDGCNHNNRNHNNHYDNDLSYVSWYSVPGQRYFVLVHSRDEYGTYNLTVREEE